MAEGDVRCDAPRRYNALTLDPPVAPVALRVVVSHEHSVRTWNRYVKNPVQSFTFVLSIPGKDSREQHLCTASREVHNEWRGLFERAANPNWLLSAFEISVPADDEPWGFHLELDVHFSSRPSADETKS